VAAFRRRGELKNETVSYLAEMKFKVAETVPATNELETVEA
jgi:hypothetical protein